MKIEFDPAKNEWNIRERGLSFETVRELAWEKARYRLDNRRAYGEVRIQALVDDTDGKPYVAIFTPRGDAFRIISLRRAHEKERKHYA